MRVLIVDCTIDRDSWGSAELRRSVGKVATMAPGASIHVRRAPEQDLPADPLAYDRIIVSGSKTRAHEQQPWISDLLAFIKRALDGGRPYLGVCFGHQMLARTLGGISSVGPADLGEIGWSKIEVLGKSPLLKGLPESFYSFSFHLDEVRQLPHGMECIARSEACSVQAGQLGGRPVFGIQFHPERDPTGTLHSFQWAREQLKEKRLDPRVVLAAGMGEELFDSQVAEKIFGNFLSI